MRTDFVPDEYGKPAEEFHMPRENAFPAPECPLMTPEAAAAPPEYETETTRRRTGTGNTPRIGKHESAENTRLEAENAAAAEARRARNRRRQVLRSIMAPVTATVASVAILFASFGFDPLKLDILNDRATAVGHSDAGDADDTPVIIATPTPKGETTPALPTPTTAEGPTPSPTPELLYGAEGNTFASPVTWTMIHVKAPNGTVFDSSLTDGDPMSEVVEWLATWNGSLDTSSMTVDRVFLGYMLEDWAIPVGDIDDPYSLYVPGGGLYSVYREDIYYDAVAGSVMPTETPTPTPTTAVTDVDFPTLPNDTPDFGGTSTFGNSEVFIAVLYPGEGTDKYLISGDDWVDGVNESSDIPGVSYDTRTNTLTLDNCTISRLVVNLMGNGFKINLVGDNHVGTILAWGFYYGGSVTLTGTGTLTVNEDRANNIGLFLNAELSDTALMIERGINVDIYGTDAAVVIGRTTLETSVYYHSGTVLSGGEFVNGAFLTHEHILMDEDGNYAGAIQGTIDELSSVTGETSYDCLAVDASGNPATELHFTDPDR